MPTKTHKTAVVLIPPQELWEPIQRIRRTYDRQVRRWMPHITLIYPFRPAEEFPVLADRLAEACAALEPFELTLAEFRWFAHGRRSFTIWLAPEPAGKVRALQAAIQQVVPDCDDVSRHAGGFTPHLSVGQVRDRQRLERLLAQLTARWEALRFVAREISLIRRGDPPDDVFRVERTASLGRPGQP